MPTGDYFPGWRCGNCGAWVRSNESHTCPTMMTYPHYGIGNYTLPSPQGWECPKCHRVYAPWVAECHDCNKREEAPHG
jgi:uncharacterized OB-fold protein